LVYCTRKIWQPCSGAHLRRLETKISDNEGNGCFRDKFNSISQLNLL
jgi:hypothetical protein